MTAFKVLESTYKTKIEGCIFSLAGWRRKCSMEALQECRERLGAGFCGEGLAVQAGAPEFRCLEPMLKAGHGGPRVYQLQASESAYHKVKLESE